jgi:hypothetical protein
MFRVNDERRISIATTNKQDGSAVTILLDRDNREGKYPEPWSVTINNKNDSINFFLDDADVCSIVEKMAQVFGIL